MVETEVLAANPSAEQGALSESMTDQAEAA